MENTLTYEVGETVNVDGFEWVNLTINIFA